MAALRQVYKTGDGFTDHGNPWGCTMFWDSHGTYVGQEQVNMLDSPGDGPEILFFKDKGNYEPVFLALTQEEMENAIGLDIPE